MTIEKRNWIVPPGLVRKVEEFFHEAEICINDYEPMLIMGDTGVGKSVFLKIFKRLYADLHPECEIVTVNCAHFQKDLARSELFGYVEGAYSGGKKKGAAGWIKKNGEGLLVLEEIGELPHEVQSMLLLFIENGTFAMLGDDKVLRSNQLVLGATNNYLVPEEPDKKPALRPDFFQRFSHFYIPPVHQRRNDVLYYLAAKFPEIVKGLRPFDILTLLAFNYPGNAREIDRIGRKLQSKHSFLEKKKKIDIVNEKDEGKREPLSPKLLLQAYRSEYLITDVIDSKDSLLGESQGSRIFLDMINDEEVEIEFNKMEEALNILNVSLNPTRCIYPFENFTGLQFKDYIDKEKRAPKFYVDEFIKTYTPRKLGKKIQKGNYEVETFEFKGIDFTEKEPPEGNGTGNTQDNQSNTTSAAGAKKIIDAKILPKLNEVLMEPGLYWQWEEKKVFEEIELPPVVTSLSKKVYDYREAKFSKLTDEIKNDVIRLNRIILETLYPNECPRHDEHTIWFLKECGDFTRAFDGLELYCCLFLQDVMMNHDLSVMESYHDNDDRHNGFMEFYEKLREQLEREHEPEQVDKLLREIDLEGASCCVRKYLNKKHERDQIKDDKGVSLLRLPQENKSEHVAGNLLEMKYADLANQYQRAWLKEVNWEFMKMQQNTGIDYRTLRNRFPASFSSKEFNNKRPWSDLCSAIGDDIKSDPPDREDEAIKWLNELLTRPSLYDVLSTKGKKYSGYVEDLLELTSSIRKNQGMEHGKKKPDLLKILNRLLIEETYPEKCPGQSKVGGKK